MSEFLVIEPSHGDITIEPCRNLFHPNTLVVGEKYIYMNRCNVGNRPVFLDVQFVAYTACPAIVVVMDGSGEKMRILRDDLYAYPLNSRHGTKQDEPSAE